MIARLLPLTMATMLVAAAVFIFHAAFARYLLRRHFRC